MGLSRIVQGLYFWTSLSTNLSQKKVSCNATTRNKILLSHQRLGHSARFPHPKCPICSLAKQSQTSFPTSTSRATNAFSLIHMDFWGPYHTPHRDESRFFLTIVDDYTRVTWVFSYAIQKSNLF